MFLLANNANVAEATDIAFNGSDIVVSGTADGHAVYWKNGIINYLPEFGARYSKAVAVAIKDGNVYFAGNLESDLKTHACIWQNGLITVLSTEHSLGLGVGINGADVYVTGSVAYKDPITGSNATKAVYWKNALQFSINNDNALSSLTRGIAFINNEPIFVGRLDYNGQPGTATYWKNGSPIKISNGLAHSSAFAIKIVDSDIYIAGTSAGGYATVWKNGIPTQLSQVISTVRAIDIKKRN